MKHHVFAILTIASIACATAVNSRASSEPRIQRPPGARRYRFTSTETTPAGSHSIRVTFLLQTRRNGTEDAMVTRIERDSSGGLFRDIVLDPGCASTIRGTSGAITTLHITPAPRDIRTVIDHCAPDDLFGAATDILPLLMIQAQPKFRATELRTLGERLTFDGYVTGWQSPPATPDARIVADSGVSSIDSLSGNRMIVSWDTSPMTVDIVRQLSPAQRALLHGHEWFAAEVAIDPRTGELLGARTRADSLVLSMVLPYESTTVPTGAVTPTPGAPVVRIIRSLRLEGFPDGKR